MTIYCIRATLWLAEKFKAKSVLNVNIQLEFDFVREL